MCGLCVGTQWTNQQQTGKVVVVIMVWVYGEYGLVSPLCASSYYETRRYGHVVHCARTVAASIYVRSHYFSANVTERETEGRALVRRPHGAMLRTSPSS